MAERPLEMECSDGTRSGVAAASALHHMGVPRWWFLKRASVFLEYSWLWLAIFFVAPAAHAETVADLLNRLSTAPYESELHALTGAAPIKINGKKITLPDRFLPANLELTRKYLTDRLRGMGYKKVHTADFTIQGLKEPYVKENPLERSQGKNLWVEIPGSVRPDEIITLGAHYDSTGKGMAGANDNATGLVAVLQIAEAFRKERPERTVRIVLFDGEEMPPFFQGSKDYFDKSKAKGENNVLFLNLDQIGFNPANTNHVGFAAKFQSRIGNLLKAANAQSGLQIEPVAYDPYLSDNLSATRNGIPAVAFFEEGKDGKGKTVGYDHYHQKTDTSDRVTPDYAMKVTKWAAASLHIAANSKNTFQNTPTQKLKQYADIAAGFRDDDEPKIADGWDAFAKTCTANFSKLK